MCRWIMKCQGWNEVGNPDCAYVHTHVFYFRLLFPLSRYKYLPGFRSRMDVFYTKLQFIHIQLLNLNTCHELSKAP